MKKLWILGFALLASPSLANASSLINQGSTQKVERSIPSTTLLFAAISTLNPANLSPQQQTAKNLIDQAGKPVVGWYAGGASQGSGYHRETQRFSPAFAERLAAGEPPSSVIQECQGAARSVRLAGYVFSTMAGSLQNQTFGSLNMAIKTAQLAFLSIPSQDMKAMMDDTVEKAKRPGTIILGDLPTCQQKAARFVGTPKGWMQNKHGIQWFGDGVLDGRAISFHIEMSAGQSMSAIIQ
jgi:hypothetical protein